MRPAARESVSPFAFPGEVLGTVKTSVSDYLTIPRQGVGDYLTIPRQGGVGDYLTLPKQRGVGDYLTIPRQNMGDYLTLPRQGGMGYYGKYQREFDEELMQQSAARERAPWMNLV